MPKSVLEAGLAPLAASLGDSADHSARVLLPQLSKMVALQTDNRFFGRLRTGSSTPLRAA